MSPPAPLAPLRAVLGRALFLLLWVEVALRVVLGNFAQSAMLQRSAEPEICLENAPSFDARYTGWLWRVPPTRLRTNSLGGRGPEVAAQAPAGTLRVVALGDSFTFGQGVEEEDTWPMVAGATMVAGGRPVEVLDFGVPGHGTPQSVALLERRLLPLEPDVVLLAVFANDLSAEDSYCLYGRGGSELSRLMLRHWYGGRLVYMLSRGGRATPTAEDVMRLGTPEQRFRVAVDRLAFLAKERGFHAAVVLLTDRAMYEQSRYCDRCTPPHDLVAGSEVPIIDLSEHWALLQQDIPRYFITGEDHLSVEGNRRMGEAVGRALLAWPSLGSAGRP